MKGCEKAKDGGLACLSSLAEDGPKVAVSCSRRGKLGLKEREEREREREWLWLGHMAAQKWAI